MIISNHAQALNLSLISIILFIQKKKLSMAGLTSFSCEKRKTAGFISGQIILSPFLPRTLGKGKTQMQTTNN